LRQNEKRDDEINKMIPDETSLDRDEKINETKRNETKRYETRLYETR